MGLTQASKAKTNESNCHVCRRPSFTRSVVSYYKLPLETIDMCFHDPFKYDINLVLFADLILHYIYPKRSERNA